MSNPYPLLLILLIEGLIVFHRAYSSNIKLTSINRSLTAVAKIFFLVVNTIGRLLCRPILKSYNMIGVISNLVYKHNCVS